MGERHTSDDKLAFFCLSFYIFIPALSADNRLSPSNSLITQHGRFSRVMSVWHMSIVEQ